MVHVDLWEETLSYAEGTSAVFVVATTREITTGNLCSHQERMQCTHSETGSLWVHEERHWSIELR